MPLDEAKGDISALVDMLIDAAPRLVRQRRQLLGAIDWTAASRQQVETLVSRLAEHGVRTPAWLTRELVLAGHHVPAAATDSLNLELRFLHTLEAARGVAIDECLVREAVEIAEAATDCDAVAAIVRKLVDIGRHDAACRVALAGWPRAEETFRIVRRLLPEHTASLPEMKVRIAGFSTVSTFAEAMVPAFARRGMRVTTSEADFGTALAELHAPSGEVDALCLLLDPHGLIEGSWRSGLDRYADQVAARIEGLVDAIGSYANGPGRVLVVNTLSTVLGPAMGHLDQIHSTGRAAMIRRTNDALAELAAKHADVVLVDSDVALDALAPAKRHDPRLWFYGRIAYAEVAMNHLAHAFATALDARTMPPVKVVAIDLDNTCWGGVFGDDGIERLACGDDPPGNAFKAFQEECLRLKAQGKLLVLLSKNNPDAIAVFRNHPGMVLKPDDFATTAIDWNPKPDNIRRLAAELKLGLDSFVFLDDSPHEREAMRRLCPEVRVPEMPVDPTLRPGWMRMLTATWPLRLTAEDTMRPSMYLAERKSREFQAAAASYEDYLENLAQCVSIEPLGPRTLPRVAQLHERTNQFNPTTRRFTEAELSRFIDDPDCGVVLLGTASDRFGDHGIVIAAVVSREGTVACIESLVMSCRVIARQIETAFLGALISHLVERGTTEVDASYTPTAKNGLVRDLYPTHGFKRVDLEGGPTERWRWEKTSDEIPFTPFVCVAWSKTS